jgi:hypothetical protein
MISNRNKTLVCCVGSVRRSVCSRGGDMVCISVVDISSLDMNKSVDARLGESML